MDNNKILYGIYMKFCSNNNISPKALGKKWRKHWKEEYKDKLEALSMKKPPNKIGNALLML